MAKEIVNQLQHPEHLRPAFLGAGKILDNLGLNLESNRRDGKKEHLVIVTNDTVDSRVEFLFRLAGYERGAEVHVINAGDTKTERSGLTSDETLALDEVDKLIIRESLDVVVKLAGNCELFSSGLYFRTETYGRAREAQCPGLNLESLSSPAIYTNIDVIRKREKETHKYLQAIIKLHITGNGTDLVLENNPKEPVNFDPPIDLRQRIGQREKGRGANFPTGEIWRNPLPTKTNGTIVLDNIDTSVRIYRDFSEQFNPKDEIRNNGIVDVPIVIKIVDGKIKTIDGGYVAKSLAYYLDSQYFAELKRRRDEIENQGYSYINPFSVYYFGTEVGIGANALAISYTTEGNVSTVEVEKQIRRIHIALGHSQTEYPFERSDSLEYVRGPVHLDFTVPEEYIVTFTTEHSNREKVLFGPAGSLERYRALGANDLIGSPYKIAVSDSYEAEGKIGVFKKMHVDLPAEVIAMLDEESKLAIAMVNGIDIREYAGSEAGDLIFITDGMHGEEKDEYEEVDGEIIVFDKLHDELSKHLLSVNKGKIILISALNELGCKNRTRWVFDDESFTNLNSEFHRYKTGDWKEFLSLPTKTAKAAWLMMKYFKTKSDEHGEKFGAEHRVLHFDRHRDADTIPIGRVDRMDNNKAQVEAIYNTFLKFGIPIVLESETWREQGLNESLTANFPGLALTLEEGATIQDLEKYYRDGTDFSTDSLMGFLRDRGTISLARTWNEEMNLIIQQIENENTYLTRARQFWKHLIKSSNIYCLKEVQPALKLDGLTLEMPEIINRALQKESWDGIFTIDYKRELKGQRVVKEGEIIACADLFFGEYKGDIAQAKDLVGTLIIKSEVNDLWTINVDEPEDAENNFYCLYGFFRSREKENTIELKLMGDDEYGFRFERKDVLKPEELRKAIDRGNTIDFSRLNIDCAVPDTIWKGQKRNGKVNFVRRKSRNR